MLNLDGLDARILLARDLAPDATILDIASRLGVSRNTVHARVRRMQEGGALGPTSGRIAPAALGRPLLAFVTLSVSQRDVDAVYLAVRDIPEVLEAHTITGNADLILRVVARDTADLHRVTQLIQRNEGVQRSNTSLATTEVISYRLNLMLRQLE
ncbi:Lrp/AsnC family transcriptional regulator [Herbiconiux sp. SYSU D00978]|uniref:Lrp/AsnC family transcriptional regulator n=1 Tax=Herbiconiux sp. SYSU D00978 TaxID=2812562 RepID=UPI001A97C39D|nr:Lrp/AsnC family transcriptional regulator [Herbiconiux sp. SYSU D00978]